MPCCGNFIVSFIAYTSSLLALSMQQALPTREREKK
jgi:hypothetical protein